jgi:hypothetical protein
MEAYIGFISASGLKGLLAYWRFLFQPAAGLKPVMALPDRELYTPAIAR